MEVAKTELDRMTEGGVHQGLVLTVPEYKYSDIRDLESATLLVALDGVTDPRNLGAIARSAAAFGADGIIVPTRRSVGVTASAWKTSAGALSRVPVAQVTNMTRTLQDVQKSGFTVIGLAADADVDLGALDRSVLTDPLVIVIGAEGAGLSPSRRAELRLAREHPDGRRRRVAERLGRGRDRPSDGVLGPFLIRRRGRASAHEAVGRPAGTRGR